MSGSAGDVHATSAQIHTALNGMLTQLAASGIARNHDSLAHALDELDMWDWLFNQASVVAHLHAFSTRDINIIHKLTMAGAYVKLEGVIE